MLNQLFISSASAQEAAIAAQGSEFSLSSFLPITVIFLIFYFLIIRPQSKKMKDHQLLIKNLKIGNKVIMNSGIFGTIKDVDDKLGNVEVEISEGVIIKILKTHVAEVIIEKKEGKETKTIAKKSKK